MKMRTEFDPKTGKMKTYTISTSGHMVTENGRLVSPGAGLPLNVQRDARKAKEAQRLAQQVTPKKRW